MPTKTKRHRCGLPDPGFGHLAVALIDTFEGAVMRAKVERSRAPLDSFERFVLPSLLTYPF